MRRYRGFVQVFNNGNRQTMQEAEPLSVGECRIGHRGLSPNGLGTLVTSHSPWDSRWPICYQVRLHDVALRERHGANCVDRSTARM